MRSQTYVPLANAQSETANTAKLTACPTLEGREQRKICHLDAFWYTGVRHYSRL